MVRPPTFVPVILAGGSGERFWPLSRRSRPKQFLTLDESGRSLLQATSDRLSLFCDGAEQVMVVTGTDYRAQVLEQLPEMPLEGTAPGNPSSSVARLRRFQQLSPGAGVPQS